MRTAILIGCLFALPALAQNTTTTTSTSTTTTTKKTVHTMASRSSRTRVWNDATRLAALLNDAQNNTNFSEATWKVVANEANMLANRIYAGSA